MRPISKMCWFAATIALVAMIHGTARAQSLSPYQMDANTLHLYHFDEEQGVNRDAASKDSAFSLSRKGGAAVMRSVEGFGNALDTRNQSDSRAITAKPISSDTMWNSATRAFTCEALVRMDFDPQAMQENRLTRMTIFSLDSNQDSSMRAFEFCLRTPGVLGSTTASLEFLRFAAEGEESRIYPIVAPLPRSGLHAAQRGKWYHVALTYSGEPNSPGNVKFYWTSLSSGATEANLIYHGTMTHEMAKQKKVLSLAIGNTARKANGYQENWVGQIDEVRISDIDRGASGFLFSKKEGGASPSDIGSHADRKRP